MNTYRQTISDIRSMSKLLSADNLINDRVVMRETISAANMIVGQSLNKRKYWQSPTLFTPLPCLEMETVPLSECCEYTNPCEIARSVDELPRIGEGLFGLAIQSVLSVDRKVKFNPITPNSYVDVLKLGLKATKPYYWVFENKLYVTNPDIRNVYMTAYFTEPVPNSLLYPTGCDCKPNPSLDLQCQNPLDQEFRFIDERMFELKQQVYKTLLSVYFGVNADPTPNQHDDASTPPRYSR
jgi:hypothetical protein